MRSFRIGYYIILLTPLISLVSFWLFLPTAVLGVLQYTLTSIFMTIWSASIILILTVGISLYVYGYLKQQGTVNEEKVILILGLLLASWGVFTYLIASAFLSDMILWSMNPDVRSLTILDYLQYWAWEAKAIAWEGTAIMLIVTSITRIRSHARVKVYP